MKNKKLVISLILIIAVSVGVFAFAGIKNRNENSPAEDATTDPTKIETTAFVKHGDSLYDGASVFDCLFYEESEDLAVRRLQVVHNVEYGTAGFTLKHAGGTNAFILLSQMSEKELAAIPPYLDKMNPRQLDYLAWRIDETMDQAISLVNGEDFTVSIFEEIGVDTKEYKDLTKDSFVPFYLYIYKLLEERGVTHEWKLYDMSSLIY